MEDVRRPRLFRPLPGSADQRRLAGAGARLLAGHEVDRAVGHRTGPGRVHPDRQLFRAYASPRMEHDRKSLRLPGRLEFGECCGASGSGGPLPQRRGTHDSREEILLRRRGCGTDGGCLVPLRLERGCEPVRGQRRRAPTVPRVPGEEPNPRLSHPAHSSDRGGGSGASGIETLGNETLGSESLESETLGSKTLFGGIDLLTRFGARVLDAADPRRRRRSHRLRDHRRAGLGGRLLGSVRSAGASPTAGFLDLTLLSP